MVRSCYASASGVTGSRSKRRHTALTSRAQDPSGPQPSITLPLQQGGELDADVCSRIPVKLSLIQFNVLPSQNSRTTAATGENARQHINMGLCPQSRNGACRLFISGCAIASGSYWRPSLERLHVLSCRCARLLQ